MARPKKYSPLKDLYLVAKVQAHALQIDTDALEKLLLETPDDQYKNELRITLAYAIRLQKGNGNGTV
jgi:hypothetical protein